MKKTLTFTAIAIAFFAMGGLSSSAQIVKIKPQPPQAKVVKPPSLGSKYIWRDGQWQWTKKIHKYEWIQGHWVKRKKGHQWVSGYWKKASGGFKWNPGHWAGGYKKFSKIRGY